MGRRDAVQFTLELAAEWRRLGARVTFEPGWEARGNGTSANYEGAVVHHTVGASSESNPLPSKNVLKLGRTGLPGPLCNSAGPWCPDGDPWIHVMSAHPANHAGASGGRSMGPLPVTSLFNPRVWGHEIDYLGDRPMTKGQHKAALIVSAGVANVLHRSTEYVRAHAETSVTGKWDPGYAPGRTIDMADFRRQAAAQQASEQEEFDMAVQDDVAEIRRMVGVLLGWPGAGNAHEAAAANIPKDAGENRRMLGVLLGWNNPATPQEAEALAKLNGTAVVDVDEQAIIDGLAPMLTSRVDSLSPEALTQIVQAVAGQLDALPGDVLDAFAEAVEQARRQAA